MNRTLTVAFVVLGTFYSLIGLAIAQKPLSLKTYVQSYLFQDEGLQLAALEHKKVLTSVSGEIDFWNSELSLKPQSRETRKELSLSESIGRRSFLEATWKQSLPWGTSFAFNHNKLFGRDSLNSVTVDSETSFSFNKSLYRNGWGKEDRLKRVSTDNQLSQSRLIHSLSYQETCAQGIKSYVQSYVSQEKVRVFFEMEKAARRVFYQLKKSYQKKLVRPIDWLGAQTDYLNTQSQRSEIEKNYNLQLAHFLLKADLPFDPEQWILRRPKIPDYEKYSKYKKHEIEKMLVNNVEIQGLQKKLLEKQTSKEIGKRQEQGDVYLNIQLSDTRGHSLIDNDEYKQLGWTASLNFTWPLQNSRLTAKKNLAALEVLGVSKEIEKKKRDIRLQWKRNLLSLGYQEKQLQLNYRQRFLQKKQVSEARRLLITGKIEFENYIGYRDQWLKSQVKYLDLLQEGILTKISLLKMSGYLQKICEEKL